MPRLIVREPKNRNETEVLSPWTGDESRAAPSEPAPGPVAMRGGSGANGPGAGGEAPRPARRRFAPPAFRAMLDDGGGSGGGGGDSGYGPGAEGEGGSPNSGAEGKPGQSTEPFSGGLSTEPFTGGQSTEPFSGGLSTEPFTGGQSAEPFSGGLSTEPFTGGQISPPDGGESIEAISGGLGGLFSDTAQNIPNQCTLSTSEIGTSFLNLSPAEQAAPETPESVTPDDPKAVTTSDVKDSALNGDREKPLALETKLPFSLDFSDPKFWKDLNPQPGPDSTSEKSGPASQPGPSDRTTEAASMSQGGTAASTGDVAAAVATLNDNAVGTQQYKGKCSYYVATAVNAGLPDDVTPLVTDDNRKLGPANGGAMGPKLEEVGYQQVSPGGYTPQAGDIAVVPGYVGDTRCGGAPCGHVAMYNGKQWVSDTNQGKNPNPYGKRPLSGEITYYRYK
jgi:hypothetical protein